MRNYIDLAEALANFGIRPAKLYAMFYGSQNEETDHFGGVFETEEVAQEYCSEFEDNGWFCKVFQLIETYSTSE